MEEYIVDKNILSGDVSVLKEYRALVEDYNNSKVLNEQAAAEEKRLEKELALNKKNLKDDIEITVKKRRNEVSDKFDKEIDKDESKLKKIRGQRSKAKNKGIKARIAEETSDLTSQNDELKANIKAFKLLWQWFLFFAVFNKGGRRDFFLRFNDYFDVFDFTCFNIYFTSF